MTINKQVVTAEVVTRMSVVAVLTEIALEKGPEVATKIMKELDQKG